MDYKYNNFREKYPSPNLIYRNRMIKEVVSNISIGDKKLLEIGCGTGSFLAWIDSINGNIDGVELDKKAYHQALINCKNLRGVNIYNYDLHDLEGIYDIIFIFDVLEHIKNDILAFKKLFELLSNNGLLLITVPGNSKLFGYKDVAIGHYRRYDKDDLIMKLSENGFKVIDFFSWGMGNLLKLNRLFIKEKKIKISLRERTMRSSYDAPPSKLVKFLHPIYSRNPRLLSFQDPFLKNDRFMNSHFLCLCRKL